MSVLEVLGKQYGTDKLSHGFLPFYESMMAPRKDTSVKFLEVGVFYGASIQMWDAYFTHPESSIVGADWFEGKNGNLSQFPNPRYVFSLPLSRKIRLAEIDQSRLDHLEAFVKGEQAESYDYILDDGSHLMRDQQITFITMFPLLKSGGVFIIEDLHTSFGGGYDVETGKMTTYTMVSFLENKLHPTLSYMPMPKSLFDQIKSAKIYTTNGGSITCAIVKK
jgi:hypothetical protein